MKTILISFQPKWFEQIKSGEKIFEYRTQFPKEPVKAYMYVSKPVQAITGYIEFGNRLSLLDWAEEYKNDIEVYQRVEEYLKRRKYVVPILKYVDTEPIYLDELKRDLDRFIIPQSYYFLDNYIKLFDYVQERTVFGTHQILNSFDKIDRNKVCQLNG